jgi:hypothetical protein
MQLLARIALIAGLGLTIYFSFELFLLSRGTSQPQELTVSELGKKGPLVNSHVTITDFEMPEEYLIETQDGRWTRVWIPLFNQEGKWTERPVLAYVTGVHDDNELSAVIDKDKLTGVVTNGMQNFGSKQQESIAPNYPGVDLSDAIAFHVGRSFPNPLVAAPLLLLGIALLVGGGGVAFGLIRVSGT